MNPTCLAPLRGHFQRILPRNRFDRLVNFVKFDILEPLWPADPRQPQLAQHSQIADKRQD